MQDTPLTPQTNPPRERTAMDKKTRPKHLDLAKIRLPISGFVSILHRVSGAGLFLLIPFLLYLLQGSLSAPEVYAGVKQMAANGFAKLVLLGLLWAFLHHLFAGLRFLALDLHYGVELAQARLTARLVLVASLVLTLIIGVRIW